LGFGDSRSQEKFVEISYEKKSDLALGTSCEKMASVWHDSWNEKERQTEDNLAQRRHAMARTSGSWIGITATEDHRQTNMEVDCS